MNVVTYKIDYYEKKKITGNTTLIKSIIINV